MNIQKMIRVWRGGFGFFFDVYQLFRRSNSTVWLLKFYLLSLPFFFFFAGFVFPSLAWHSWVLTQILGLTIIYLFDMVITNLMFEKLNLKKGMQNDKKERFPKFRDQIINIQKSRNDELRMPDINWMELEGKIWELLKARNQLNKGQNLRIKTQTLEDHKGAKCKELRLQPLFLEIPMPIHEAYVIIGVCPCNHMDFFTLAWTIFHIWLKLFNSFEN